MSVLDLSNGSTVRDLNDAAFRLKKGSEVCIVEIDGELKSYPLSREGYFKEMFGEDKVFIVEGQV